MKKKSSTAKGKTVKKKAGPKAAKRVAKGVKPKAPAKRKSAAGEKYSQSGAPWWKEFI